MQLIAQAEVHLPVMRGERVRVQVVRGVHAGTGIAVLPPDPADRAVALDDLVGHTGLLEIDGGAQPRSTCTDHQHLEAGRNLDGVVVQELGEPELGGRESAVLVGHVLAHGGAEHPGDERVVGLGNCHRAAVTPCRNGFQRRLAYLLLVLGGEAAGVVVTQAGLALGPVRLIQPMQLAGHLDQHHQQRRDVRHRDCCGERLVVHVGPARSRRRAVGDPTGTICCIRLRHL